MWRPRGVADLERAIVERLPETAQLDYKRQLPSNNLALAVDVAAMANEGGVLVFGVAEDDAHLPVELVPIRGLQTACEQIDQIVAQRLSGPPSVRFWPIRIADGADEGYLVVEVPPSPWAPHMVLAKHRYYGRGETGNRPLGDHEVAALFARRARWELDRDRLLDDALARMPLPYRPMEGVGVVVCRPVLPDPGLLDRRRAGPERALGPKETLVPAIELAAQRALNRFGWRHDLASTVDWTPSPRGGFRGSILRPDHNNPRPEQLLLLQVDGDGTITVLTGAAVQQVPDRGLLVAEGLIALLVAQACVLSAVLLNEGGYAGPVDVALHVDGLTSAVSYQRHAGHQVYLDDTRRPYGEDRYRASRRVDLSELLDDPVSVARELVWQLTRVTAGEEWDPAGLIRP